MPENPLEAAAQRQLPYAHFLADLLASETTVRRERYPRAWTRLAHLPFHRTLDPFDFGRRAPARERTVP